MNWNRIKHISGLVVGGILAVGPLIVPVIPPAIGVPVGAVLLALSRLDKALGWSQA